MGVTCHNGCYTPNHESENEQIRAVLILSALFVCLFWGGGGSVSSQQFLELMCFFFLVRFAIGGSGKGPRTKDQKKKSNKQRLRFRAQNQHSDHLASVRAAQ